MTVLDACAEKQLRLSAARLLNLGDGIIPHGTVEELRHAYGIGAVEIVRCAVEMVRHDMVET